jgi:uncharacterized membrane protein YebE (DUF533 family)
VTPTETLHTVITLLMGDGKLGLRETRFVRDLAQRLGFGSDAWAEVVARVEKGDRKLVVPREPDEAQEVMGLLIDAAAVNGDVDDSERRMLRKVAERVGISEADLSQLIAAALARIEPGGETRRDVAPASRNIAIVKAALSVLRAEGGVTDAEQGWLDALASRLGVDLWQLPPGDVSLDDLMAGTPAQREEVFRTLVQAAKADGVLGIMERGKLAAFGAVLDIPAATIRDLTGERIV